MAVATPKKRVSKKGGRKAVTKKATKKTPVKKVQRNRPLLDDEGLKAEESRLRKSFPRIVEGSLRNRGDREGYGLKRTVVIKCKTKDCPNTRVVATSDLHQVEFCEACTAEKRLARKQKARRARSPK